MVDDESVATRSVSAERSPDTTEESHGMLSALPSSDTQPRQLCDKAPTRMEAVRPTIHKNHLPKDFFDMGITMINTVLTRYTGISLTNEDNDFPIKRLPKPVAFFKSFCPVGLFRYICRAIEISC